MTYAAMSEKQFSTNKILYHSSSIVDWLNGDVPTPVCIELDISLLCNDHCNHCTYGFSHTKRYLSLSQIDGILSDAAELGIRGLTITGGGDPLTHPEFSSILEIINKYDFSTGIFTNADNIRNYDQAKYLVATFDWIRVSLDCASDTAFYQIRGKRDFARRLEKIKLLSLAKSDYKDCELGISYLTNADNAQDILLAGNIAKEIGCDYIHYKPMINWNRATNHHMSEILPQGNALNLLNKSKSIEDDSFSVFYSPNKYVANKFTHHYKSYHIAWFVVAIGIGIHKSKPVPTMFLDCSSKYYDEWKIGKIKSLKQVLCSEARKNMIINTSSKDFCIPSDRHAHSNSILDDLLSTHHKEQINKTYIESLAPDDIAHPFNI